MDSVQQNIAKNLLKIRKGKGLTLEKAAELTGVSKAMLGQIERNESTPTVSTLWKIATGLRVSFSSLMKGDERKVTTVCLEDVEPVINENGKYKVFSLFPFEPGKQFELFTVVLDASYSYEAEAHLPGIEEYIVVQKGKLDVVVNGEKYSLKEGEAIHFLADVPHTYCNETEEVTHFMVMIYYPES